MSEYGYNSEGNPTDYQWKLEKQRQFQHNDCSGPLAGYHFDDVNVKVDIMRGEIEQLQQQNAELNAKYQELLFGVAQKFPNESRHQTALRYIQQREAEAVSGEGG